jgi:hypothetical protein
MKTYTVWPENDNPIVVLAGSPDEAARQAVSDGRCAADAGTVEVVVEDVDGHQSVVFLEV